MRILCFISIFLITGSVFAQEEDTLTQKLFGSKDLMDVKKKGSNIVTSANLLAEDAQSLPQQVIIVEGDDIRKFGYTTLVDVLKNIPGFRTSQPGNALDGETFLMRGLVGNDYAKILINGIPIKPEAVRGMPIASQLPIRHAERIEIVMGPSSAAYGSDAMAGVINIVLPEIDRPVFAWADINLGSNAVSEFNLTLGGKMGKGKNILNYQFFASSYQSGDKNLLIPDDSIRVEPGDLSQYNQPYYISETDDMSLPEIDYLPSSSRLVGGYLSYRWFELNATAMSRTEHSAIGSDPLVSAYHDPSFYISDNINVFSFKYHDEKDKRYISKASISTITYRTDPGSSFHGVDNIISNGRNFMYARSLDARADYQGVFKVNKRMNIVAGVVGQYSISHAFTNYLRVPFKYDGSSFQLPTNLSIQGTPAVSTAALDSISLLGDETYIPEYLSGGYATFLQFSYASKGGKFHAVVGTRLDVNAESDSTGTNFVDREAVFTPKAGINYRPSEKWRFRAFYGSGHRMPRSFFVFNSYQQQSGLIQQGEGLLRKAANINSEVLDGGEVGAEWSPHENFTLGGTYYLHLLQNRLIREELTPIPNQMQNSMQPIGFKYFNTKAYSLLSSVGFIADYKQPLKNGSVRIQFGYDVSGGIEFIDTETENGPPQNTVVDGYRFMPKHNFKLNGFVELYGVTMSITNQLFGDYISDVTRKNGEVTFERQDGFFMNTDITLHRVLFRQLSAILIVRNVFNTTQSGLTHVNLADSWSFNPQYGRTFKFGLNFKLN